MEVVRVPLRRDAEAERFARREGLLLLHAGESRELAVAAREERRQRLRVRKAREASRRVERPARLLLVRLAELALEDALDRRLQLARRGGRLLHVVAVAGEGRGGELLLVADAGRVGLAAEPGDLGVESAELRRILRLEDLQRL